MAANQWCDVLIGCCDRSGVLVYTEVWADGIVDWVQRMLMPCGRVNRTEDWDERLRVITKEGMRNAEEDVLEESDLRCADGDELLV